MRIGSVAASVTGLNDEPLRYTRASPKDGMNLDTGSLSSKAPSSYSIIAATDAIGLVIENNRTTVSSTQGSDASRSRYPAVAWWTRCP
jgi:hypothetical protein